ncbi:methyl-accepting chemotaxis protein, partial [Domibacillus robiginosus]|uniref:methyl-accepting chemotaxis protein n=1 Tax=Domibacillus robiginosus TaxID=1071054 RepID=UPI00067D3B4F
SWEEELSNNYNEMETLLNDYEASVSTTEEKKNFDSLLITIEDYRSTEQQLLNLTPDSNAEDGSTLGDQFEKQREEIGQYISNLVEINEQNAADSTAFVDEMYKAKTMQILLLIGISALLSILIASLMIRSISRPIQFVSQALQQVASGDLTGPKLNITNKDEIGLLVSSFNTVTENLTQTLKQVQDAAHHVSASSEELTASFEQNVVSIEQVSHLSQISADGSEEQLKQVEQIGFSIREMSSALKHIDSNSSVMTALSQEAFEATKKGNQQTAQVVEQMQEINHSVEETAKLMKRLGDHSTKIGDIIVMITALAEQTNLLALNAAIEAARAGQQGKGFAVVAEEVRKLATDSKNSSSQIAHMVRSIQQDIEQAKQSIHTSTEKVSTGLMYTDNVNTSFGHIEASISNVSDKTAEVTASIGQIETISHQIVQAMDSMKDTARKAVHLSQETSSFTQEQTATAEEISSSAFSLSQLAGELQHTLTAFKMK